MDDDGLTDAQLTLFHRLGDLHDRNIGSIANLERRDIVEAIQAMIDEAIRAALEEKKDER